TTIPTTAAPSCSAAASTTMATGQLVYLTSTSPSNTYANYTYNFTATSVLSTLRFAFKGGGAGGSPGPHRWYLDNVSVKEKNTSNTEMLINGGFEMGDLTGWTLFCNSSCGSGTSGVVVADATYCYVATGSSYCYYDWCNGGGSGNYDYISQSFTSVIGYWYVMRFSLRQSGTGGPVELYASMN
ncbi:unnamed protein product, partial [Didymodactylos carnosus]